MRVATAVALAFILALAAGAPGPVQARPSVSVSVSFFYDSLAPHGYWYDSPRYGYVWQPAHLYAGWRPYFNGRWAYTDVGWTFVSYDPWGWATDHYGRWYLDPILGWVWVPGSEWAPAWVTFYEADDWIGWAPLPPGAGFSLAFIRRPVIDPGGYCFVEKRHFMDAQIHRRVVAPSRNTALIRHSRESREAGLFVHRGPSVQRIAQATNRPVPRLRVVETADARGASRARVRGQEVEVFRPQVSAKPTHPPRGARAVPARQIGRPEARQQPRGPERRLVAPAPQQQRRPAQVAPARQQQRRSQQVAPAPQQQRRPAQAAPARQQQRRSQQVAPAPQRQRRAPQVAPAPHRNPRAHAERAAPPSPRRQEVRQQQRPPRREARAPSGRPGQQPRAVRPDRGSQRQPQVRPQGRERSPARNQPPRRERPRGPRPPGS